MYNHLGPEGNVLPRYGPYFVDTTRTPWGDALNVAGAGSDEVRDLFVQSACQWIEDFHVDGLRLDAVDAIVDQTARPFLEELGAGRARPGRRARARVLVVAESASNDPRLVTPVEAGGVGLDGMWNDDVHHCLHVALLGDRRGYYADYDGVGDLAHALAHRWVFDGRYSAFRGRRHGRSADHVDPRRLVVFAANHDHVGNTPDGRRPPYGRAGRLVAAATVVLGPFTPLLFMGEEYAETGARSRSSSTTPTSSCSPPRGPGARPSSPAPAGTAPSPTRPTEATFRAAVLDPSRPRASRTGRCWRRRPSCSALRRARPVLTDRVRRPRRDARRRRRHRDPHARRRRHPAGARVRHRPVDVALDGAGWSIAFDADDPRWGGAGATVLEGGRLRSGARTRCSSFAAVIWSGL